jgi:dTDP-4-amino-4,6-dideoxygalactose transaminase
MTVPFLDLARVTSAVRKEIDGAIADVLDAGRFILGVKLEAFETAFASVCGVRHAVGVGSGTDALRLALAANGVGPGDEVVTVSNTCVPTAAAISGVGAVPVFADVDARTYTLDPAALEARITARTRAIVPVHLYGQCADMDPILAIANRRGIPVVEDCAQAHGARVGDRIAGSMGRAGAYSFYPTKNLGALGDGGIVVTDDVDVARNLRELREYGWRERYISAVPGMNTRLDEMQAAILRVKLRRLAADNDRRRAIAASYDRGLAGLAVDLPAVGGGAQHVYHQYVIRSPKRDGLRQRLRDRSIGTNIHYPAPVHLQPAYRGRVSLGVSRCAATEAILPQVLSLPMFPQLTDEQVERVVREIRDAVADGGR